MWPLKHAQRMLPGTQKVVPLLMGTNQLGRVQLDSIHLPPINSNAVTALALAPTPVGSNLLLTLEVRTNALVNAPEPDMVVLKNYSPIGAFMVALQLALYGGLGLASPFVIFFIGQFVLPALKVKEKSWLYRVAGIGTFLFLAGVAFCYFVIVQVALMASVQFSQWMGFGADEWRAEDYISFVCKFMLGMGLSFQLPLVILTLVKIGLVDHEMLSKYRAYFIVGNLIVSAVVTPSGDPVTMVLMALPLQFLYEVSALIARAWAKKDRLREAAEG
jgi:sec-independent protein translocase protein TatC